MRHRVLLVPTLAIVIAGAHGCDSTHIGNPPEQPDINPLATASIIVTALAAESGQGLHVPTREAGIDTAWVVLSDIQLTPADDCTDEAQIDIEGPIVVDLLSGTTLPSVPMLSRPAGVYCRMKFKLQRKPNATLPVGSPPELETLSVWVEGHRSDGVPFVLEEDKPNNIVLDSDEGRLELLEGEQQLVLAFDLDAWLAPELLDAIPDDGPIHINATEQRELYLGFQKQLRLSPSLFRDGNGDGRLDATEEASPLAIGVDEAPSDVGGRGSQP